MSKTQPTIEPLAEYPAALPIVARWVWETWPSKTYEQTVESLCDLEGCPPNLIAVADRTPVGVIGIGRFQRDGDTAETLWINALFVVESKRSMGIGSRLLSAAVESATSTAEALYVYTDVGPWYQDRGWTPLETTEGGTVLRLDLPAGSSRWAAG